MAAVEGGGAIIAGMSTANRAVKQRSLELVRDVAGDSLVLSAPPSGLANDARELLRSTSAAASTFAREIRDRPRSPRGLLGSFGLLLIAGTLCALILLACLLAIGGIALVVVLYVLGAWLVAWWLVAFVARRVIDARPATATAENLTHLSFSRSQREVAWQTHAAKSCSFGALAGARLSIRTCAGADCDIVLHLLPAEPGRGTKLRFSVASVDREEEALDLCLRMARVVGWQAYATTRDDLRGMEIELRATPPAARAHPFRSYAAPPGFIEVGSASATTTDWSLPFQPGFREPIESPPAFDPADLGGASATVKAWRPQAVVELMTRRSGGGMRRLWGVVVASSVALALPASVLFLVNAAAGVRPWETHQGERLSLAGVLALLTCLSAALGWLLALGLAARRSGQKAARFDWRSRELVVIDDDGRAMMAFSQIVELVLTIESGGRCAVSASLEGRAPQLLLESGSAPKAMEAWLSLTVELARALDVAWRCTSDTA